MAPRESAPTYVIAAGGTGGHIFPAIALGREIAAQRPEARVVMVGTAEGLEARLFREAGFELATVRASGFAGKRLAGRVAALARLPLGILEARRLLRRLLPRAVAGLGGYVSVPVLLAAGSLGIPTLVHESNALPGVANRLLAKRATVLAVTLEEAAARLGRPAAVTGTPVRREFFAAPPLAAREARRRVLLFGGSQGSAALNRAAVAAVPALAAAGVEVVHQTGEKWIEDVRAAYGTTPPGARLEPFLPRLWEEMAAADLVVSRAGAMTLAELAAAGRPAILVPLATATHGHQLENARAFAAAGAATVLEEADLSGESLAAAVRAALADPAALARRGAAARGLAREDASRRLAELLFAIERSAA
jgi:UDP-N-acetylglucosamine--N-acetylmuramyl-(pentapeptide) pyrophosphoryl-undecaprenol N-acetylglucosamine transferase